MCTYIYIGWRIYVYIFSISRESWLCTGWRRLIVCLKLQIIFCKRATNYRALLRKMTYKDKPSYASSPLCIMNLNHISQVRWHRYEHFKQHEISHLFFCCHPVSTFLYWCVALWRDFGFFWPPGDIVFSLRKAGGDKAGKNKRIHLEKE